MLTALMTEAHIVIPGSFRLACSRSGWVGVQCCSLEVCIRTTFRATCYAASFQTLRACCYMKPLWEPAAMRGILEARLIEQPFWSSSQR